MNQEPFLNVVKLELIHSYYKRRYVDSSVPQWTILSGIN